MTLVKHTKIDSFFSSQEKAINCQLFLLYGESYLIKEGLEKLKQSLLKDSQNQLAMETLEGGSITMGDIIEQVSTFSFLTSQKIVLVKNAPLFDTGTRPGEIQFKASDLDLLSDFIEKDYLKIIS